MNGLTYRIEIAGVRHRGQLGIVHEVRAARLFGLGGCPSRDREKEEGEERNERETHEFGMKMCVIGFEYPYATRSQEVSLADNEKPQQTNLLGFCARNYQELYKSTPHFAETLISSTSKMRAA